MMFGDGSFAGTRGMRFRDRQGRQVHDGSDERSFGMAFLLSET
jgi:hypothetical protein